MKKMFKIPFLSLTIWLLFLISPLSHSLSHALQDYTDEPFLPIGGELSESSHEEEKNLVGFDAIGLRKMGSGRKRVEVKRIVKKGITTPIYERQEDEESSRISGLYKKSSNKARQTSQVNHDQETIDAKRSKISQHVYKVKWTNSKRVILARDDESQRLLKAAREIANLMHKDYKEWAHRKPPINNREPLH
ncbi:hypothetical protein IC582_016255 [Cucumis melo]|uniref:Uncharacterized protein n=2 Tax=Cucumis melo TaxID=3656 RepID=A0A5A7UKD7_CUCMM|nr:uncharacterized protein LOC103495712 [Cucumis melo]KAA0054746.1 uncharacterized protein E6C27_scaffold437G00200 [Cucumis melo var. makuwa]